MADLRPLVADPAFQSLPADRQRVVASQVDPEGLGKLPDHWAQDRLLTRLAPDPYAFTEQRHGLPPGMMHALEGVESGGQQNPDTAVSPTGVRGRFQITGATGHEFGLPDDQWEDPIAQLSTAGNILASRVQQHGSLRGGVAHYGDPNQANYADLVFAKMKGFNASTSTTDQPLPQPGLGESLRTSIAGGEQRVEDAIRRVGSSMHAGYGFGGESPYEGRALPLIGDLATIANPIVNPAGVGLGTGAEVASRATGIGNPELVNNLTQVLTAVAPIIPRMIGRVIQGTRLLSPTARAAGKLAAENTAATTAADLTNTAAQREADLANQASATNANMHNVFAQGQANARLGEQGGAVLGQAGQLGSQAEAGTAVQATLPRMVGRLERTTQQSVQSAERYTGKHVIGEKLSSLNKPPTPPVTLYDASGKAMSVGGKAPEPVTLGEIPDEVLSLHAKASKETADLLRFNDTISQRLAGMHPIATAQMLGKNPDLVNALLAHATPDEVAMIQHAQAVGSPLSKLPYSASDFVAKLMLPTTTEAKVVEPTLKTTTGSRSLFSHLADIAIGALAGHAGFGTATKAAAVGVGLKMLDLAASNPVTTHLMTALLKMPATDPGFLPAARALVSVLGGPVASESARPVESPPPPS